MASEEGGRRKALSEYPLSGSVSSVLRDAAQLRQGHGGALDTGTLFYALVRRGGASEDGHYAPTVLRSLVERQSGGGFEVAASRFLAFGASEESAVEGQPDGASAAVADVLASAALLPQHDGILAARHLVVALLAHVAREGAKTSAWRLLQSARLDCRELLVAFVATLPQFAPEPERAEWSKLLRQLRGVSRSGPLRPSFDTDTPHGTEGHDCLDLSATVSAMANLIASPHLDGNLSLGVFGNWGSGKSFFMRRLRDAIRQLSALSRDDAEQNPTEPPAYWQNVVQIEFNAWHYVDANLWASLVSHLLEELSRLSPPLATAGKDGTSSSSSEPTLGLALSQLRLATDARNEATRLQESAESARDDAKLALRRAGDEAADAAKALAQAAAAPIWLSVRDKVAQTLDSKALLESLETLGVRASTKAGEDRTLPDALRPLYDQLRDITSVAGRTHAVFERTLRAEGGGRALLECTLLVIIPLVSTITLSYLLDNQRELTSTIGATLVGLVGAAARSAKWVRDQAIVVTRALEPLNAARRRIAAALDEAEAEKASALSELEKKLALRNVALEAAQKAVQARETQVQEAARAVTTIVSGTAIARFIEQRLASSDYQKHLGLIAVIRRDFEQLSQLILGHNAQRLRLSADVTRIESELRLALPDLAPKDLQKMFQNLGVNRIVIYIDDLDRCPSERVVEVLQAIHLLLAFPVFVVVVGVDARWMSHSLAKEYPSMLARRSAGGVAETSEWLGRVSPSDYLEKIFQIPFWVPPLDAAATKLLLGRLTGASSADDAVSPSQRLNPSKHPSSEGVYRSRAPAASPPAARSAPGAASGAAPPPPAVVTEKPRLARPEALTCTTSELQAMQELALVIGRSPRATKRFVNCYRLLKAALTEKELNLLADDELGGLTAPMFLLAVVTGAPNLSGTFLSDEPTTVRTPLEHLRALAAAPSHDADAYDTSVRIREFCSSSVPERWQRVTFEDRRRWATRVAQFAFEDLTTGPLPPLAPAAATVPPSSATQPVRATS